MQVGIWVFLQTLQAMLSICDLGHHNSHMQLVPKDLNAPRENAQSHKFKLK